MSIKIEISIGELLDKISILEIKSERIDDSEKLENIEKERAILINRWNESHYSKSNLDEERTALKKINEQLWEIEDAIREKEKKRVFDDEFINLARSVYITNDERAKVKKQICKKTGSTLVEEKSYSEY